MRNSDYLDTKQPEDEFIGKLKTDKKGRLYRNILGKKVYQCEELTQRDADVNLCINRERVRLALKINLQNQK